jgi:hypothetical protein
MGRSSELYLEQEARDEAVREASGELLSILKDAKAQLEHLNELLLQRTVGRADHELFIETVAVIEACGDAIAHAEGR